LQAPPDLRNSVIGISITAYPNLESFSQVSGQLLGIIIVL